MSSTAEELARAAPRREGTVFSSTESNTSRGESRWVEQRRRAGHSRLRRSSVHHRKHRACRSSSPSPALRRGCSTAPSSAATAGLRRRRSGRPPPRCGARAPRCGSANTKFCYYNNYNLAQPRHLCRACRRYWTKGGHLRNVPVGGACRKTKRPAAADGSGIHGARRDGKAPRHGCAAASSSSSSSPAADGDAVSRIAVAQASRAFCVVTEPSGATSRSSAVAEAGAGVGSSTAGDAGALPLVPPPASMFTDQAAVFASLFAPPRPLPAFGYSAPQEPEGDHVAVSHAVEQQPPAFAAAGEGAAPFAARSDGALAAGASSDWPTAASDDGGIFGLSGGIAGDASLLAYWKTGSWTNTDTTVYLP